MATKVITGVNTRWSYANVWEAKAMEGGKPKFSVSLIIPKSDTVTVGKIKTAIEEAAMVTWSVPMILPMPMPTSLMLTPQQHPVWLMPIGTKSWTSLRFTPAVTAELASTSMPSMPTVTAVSPVVLTICRSLETENL